MGDPAMYPEIRAARNVYALQRLPSDFTADPQARKQWVDNNLTYLDGVGFGHRPSSMYVSVRRRCGLAQVGARKRAGGALRG